MKHVIVLGAQVPFTIGGAEIHVNSLVQEINKLDDVKAELVQLPFKWYPEKQMLNDIMAWRLLDLSESNGKKIDLVIASKFPTYALKHENKALWLIHQHRTLYDLENTEYDCWGCEPDTEVLRDKIRELDRKFFSECKCIFTNGRTTAKRMKKYNGINGQPLFPPPKLADQIHPGYYGEKIIYIGRLEPNKRPDLMISSAAKCNKAKISIIGKGRKEDHERLKILIEEAALCDRCELLGYLPDSELLVRLSNARAVFYAPYDEDYGYATIEAFLAQKPVISTYDSGEVGLFVSETGSGYLSDTSAEEVAENINKIYELDAKQLKDMAMPGYEMAKTITWGNVLEKLVLKNLYSS